MGATIKDIARATGLGLATVSSYLNGGNVREGNRKKIEAAIKEYHFEVNEMARSLKTNRTRTIGMLIPEINNIFCAEIISEAEDILRRHGYATIVYDCRTDVKQESDAVDFLLRRRVDGAIVMPSGKSGKAYNKFLDAGKSVVLIDRKVTDVSCDCVIIDNKQAVEECVARLVSAGHKNIGFITGSSGIYTSGERLKGYKSALKKAGIALDSRLIANGDYIISGGARAMKEILANNPDITSVIASNYEMTVGAVIALNEAGLSVPGDISFIGFDNMEFARTYKPSLNIVMQPTKQMAYEAANLLIKRIENQEISSGAKTIVLAASFSDGKSIRDIR